MSSLIRERRTFFPKSDFRWCNENWTIWLWVFGVRKHQKTLKKTRDAGQSRILLLPSLLFCSFGVEPASSNTVCGKNTHWPRSSLPSTIKNTKLVLFLARLLLCCMGWRQLWIRLLNTTGPEVTLSDSIPASILASWDSWSITKRSSYERWICTVGKGRKIFELPK